MGTSTTYTAGAIAYCSFVPAGIRLQAISQDIRRAIRWNDIPTRYAWKRQHVHVECRRCRLYDQGRSNAEPTCTSTFHFSCSAKGRIRGSTLVKGKQQKILRRHKNRYRAIK